MTADAIAISVTIGSGLIFLAIALGVAIFLGLRGFTSKVNDQVSNAKDDIVEELSDIKETLTKIDTTTNNLVQIATGASTGTVIRKLENFGETQISATPGPTSTTYTVIVQRGMMDIEIMGRASLLTGLTETEVKMFSGRTVRSLSLGNRRIRLIVPSTDPKICTEYMSIFLSWLDTKYHNELQSISIFEDNIKIDKSN